MSSGNVGIGTTEPKALLNVTGKTIINSSLTAAPTNGLYGSDGTRLIMILWPGAVDNVPYSFGVTGSTLWYSVPTGAIHAFYVRTTERMRNNSSRFVGVNINDPKCHLQVNGIGNINNGSPFATVKNYMQSGSLTKGGINANYGGGNNWTGNAAGLMMECLDNTEIAVHDSGHRLASLMYFEGSGVSNRSTGKEFYRRSGVG